MDPIKRQRLEASGWVVGDSSDFLELTPEEEAAIEAAIQTLPSAAVRELPINTAHVNEPERVICLVH